MGNLSSIQVSSGAVAQACSSFSIPEIYSGTNAGGSLAWCSQGSQELSQYETYRVKDWPTCQEARFPADLRRCYLLGASPHQRRYLPTQAGMCVPSISLPKETLGLFDISQTCCLSWAPSILLVAYARREVLESRRG